MVNRRLLDPRLAIVLFCIAAVFGCKKKEAEKGADVAAADTTAIPNVECPHGEDFILYIRGKRYTARDFQNTQAVIPEYNDCQALVVNNAYGPRVAIFAYDRLVPATLAADTLVAGPTALAVGLIVDLDPEGYAPLGIESGFNCLYLWLDQSSPTPKRVAKVVPVVDKNECDVAVDPMTRPGMVLDVQRKKTVNLTAIDYPGVARWGWDPTTSAHYIGIKCADGWCSAGPPGFSGDMPVVAELGWTFDNPRPSPSEIARTFAANGWYDYQHLAINGPNGQLIPGQAAYVFPHPKLGSTKTVADFDALEATLPGHWVPAAYVFFQVSIPEYKNKWNFEKGWNRIWMCNGDSTYCTIPAAEKPTCPTSNWWVKVQSAETHQAKYFCVTYTDHEMEVPGTVRWRWDPTDEKLWIRCPQGCCQVN